MSDIFISYAAEDRDRAKRLAEALQSQRWTVWWDRDIPFGKRFDDVITEALAAARCVIVLWTRQSVKSHWVRTEAGEGAARDVLVPIRLDADAEIPLEFKRLQTADLSDWMPGTVHQEFDLLLRRIAGLVKPGASKEMPGIPLARDAGTTAKPVEAPGRAAPPGNLPAAAAGGESSAAPALPERGRHRALVATSFILVPTALVAGAALALMAWRLPTAIKVDLVVERVELRLAGAGQVPMLGAAPSVQRLVVESFSRIVFTPAAQGLLVPSKSTGGSSAWKPVPDTGELALLGNAAAATKVTVNPVNGPQASAGRLAGINLAPNTVVTAEASRPGVLRIKINGQRLAPTLLPDGQFEVKAENASTVPQIQALSEANPMRFRAGLDAAAPIVRIESLPEELKLTLVPVTADPVVLLFAVPVSGIRFAKLVDNEERSALRAEGTLSYPPYEGKGPIRFAEHELPVFAGLEGGQVTKLSFDPKTSAIAVALVADQAEVVESKTPGGQTGDRRLSAFDKLWHGSKIGVIFTICAWVASFLFGLYKLFK